MNFKEEKVKFQALGFQKVKGSFDGGAITSDSGGLLLREVAEKSGILKDFASCFTDCRKYYQFSILELLSQRIYGIALGYEDLNDHDELRNDPTLMVLTGNQLAGKSTLNRLELSSDEPNRYCKILFDSNAIEKFFVKSFIKSKKRKPKRIIIDLDATDDAIHGNQEGKHYHGYYQHYCYLPLYIFCGSYLLCAKLRESNIDASVGSIEELERIIGLIRKYWPKVKILIRGDAGFTRDPIITWCEKNHCEYVFGLAKNQRLLQKAGKEIVLAKEDFEKNQEPCRYFTSFDYQTLNSWSQKRRVIAKAEHLAKGSNPRFIVTSLKGDSKYLYEKVYCARGEMENRIKEMKLDLFSGRTSCSKFRANQLRLWFSAVAYVLLNELRNVALKETELAKAQCATIRLKLLKIGASVIISSKQIYFHFASAYPFQELFKKVLMKISAA